MPTLPASLFLDALSPARRQALESRCVEVDLPIKKVLYEPEGTPRYAYFLTSGIASVVTATGDGDTAEVGLIGNEGVVGSFHLLGPAKVSTKCYIQLAATALRMPFLELVSAFRRDEEIRDRLLEFVQEQALILSHIAGCNQLHGSQERLSRWLLMTQDQTQSDVLDFTQEFLAMMLGVRRPTVTVLAGGLQRSGLIEYERGKVRIVNRQKLEVMACDCYRVAKELYTNLYSQTSPGIASESAKVREIRVSRPSAM